MNFDCPRCGDPSEERFYGPCAVCSDELHLILPPAPDRRYVAVTLTNGTEGREFRP